MPITNPISMTLPGIPEATVGLAAIERQRALAQALQQQALQPLQGGVASGPMGNVNTPISWTQGLAKLMQGYVAGKSGENLDQKQLELMKGLQSNYSGMFGGGSPVPEASSPATQTALSDTSQSPNDLGMPSGGPGPTVQHAALAQALQSPNSPPIQSQGPLQIPGVSPSTAMLAYSLAPDKYAEALLKQRMGPDVNQLTDALGIQRGSPEYQQIVRQALTKSTHTPLDIVRQNSIALDPAGSVRSYNPPPIPGAFPTFQGGMPTGYQQAPGAQAILAGNAAATAGGTEAGKAPYDIQTLNTEGAPTAMTRQQVIEKATGQPMRVPGQQPAQQPTRLTAPDDATAASLASQLNGHGPFSVSVGPAPAPGDGLKLQDQGASAAQKELGQNLGKEAAAVFTNGAAAVQANRQLDNMNSLVQSYSPNNFQSLKATVGAYFQGLGMPEDEVNKALGTNIGDIRALTSQSIQMAGKLTRQTDAQPSQIQFLKNLQSMPNADMTPQGFQKVLAYMKDINNYQIEKMLAQNEWLKDPANKGDPTGFEAAWAKKAKTLPFVWNQPQAVPQATVRKYNPATGKIE